MLQLNLGRARSGLCPRRSPCLHSQQTSSGPTSEHGASPPWRAHSRKAPHGHSFGRGTLGSRRRVNICIRTIEGGPSIQFGTWIGLEDNLWVEPLTAGSTLITTLPNCNAVYGVSEGFAAVKLFVGLDGRTFFPCPDGV